MVLKFLYAIVAVLIVVVGVQMWSAHHNYSYLEKGSLAQSYGASPDKAKVTVLLFTDYTCRLCKDSNASIMQAVSEKSDTRLIIHPIPQGTALSERAARIALAAAKQGGFIAMNELLMRNEKPLTDDLVRELADRVKLDGDKMLAEANDQDITDRLNRVSAELPRLGVRGVPTVIFNRNLVFVPVDAQSVYSQVSQLIEKVRS